jgi:predicted nucleic acid-binding protein
MHSSIISDTSCFIVLDKIGSFELLEHLYGEILTTPEVAGEYGKPLPNWVHIQAASDQTAQSRYAVHVGMGEASAIALAQELPDAVVIMDDYKARSLAQRLGIRVTGTLGIIIKAKNNGIIPSVRPLMERLRSTDFRFSDELEAHVYLQAGE